MWPRVLMMVLLMAGPVLGSLSAAIRHPSATAAWLAAPMEARDPADAVGIEWAGCGCREAGGDCCCAMIEGGCGCEASGAPDVPPAQHPAVPVAPMESLRHLFAPAPCRVAVHGWDDASLALAAPGLRARLKGGMWAPPVLDRLCVWRV